MRPLLARVARAARVLSLLSIFAACAGAPGTDTARCPTPPDPAVVAASASPIAAPGDATRGAELFARECTRCHSPLRSARESRFFRDYPRLDCAEYLAVAPAAYLFRAISDGGAAIGRDELMKPFSDRLSEQEVADLVAFLLEGV